MDGGGREGGTDGSWIEWMDAIWRNGGGGGCMKWMEGWIEGGRDRRIDGWMDGWMDGWRREGGKNRWIDTSMDSWIGWMDSIWRN